MRKEYIALLSTATILSSPAAAQNCTVPPSCESLGYVKTAADCEGLDTLKCPFDQSKLYCPQGGGNISAAAPGAILYSDGTISDGVIASKTPVGIVAYVNGSTRFAVALTEIETIWSNGYEDVSCLTDYNSPSTAMTDMNGKTNTMCLINHSSHYSYPAAEYCNNYKPVSSGTGSGGWYLPAAGELYSISFSYDTINLGLQKLSETQISSKYYWSSSETNTNFVWKVEPFNGHMTNDYAKNHNKPVRCVLAF